MKRTPHIAAFLLISLLLICCRKEMPLMEDGSLVLRVVVTDISNVIPIDPTLGYAPVANAELTLKSRRRKYKLEIWKFAVILYLLKLRKR